MAVDFKKWNAEFGGEEAIKELNEVKANTFTEVPDGTYVCKVEKMELAESQNGKPMVKAMFRITEGEHKNQCVFYNQVVTRGFPQHKCLEFLRSLNVLEESEVDFDGSFDHFNDLLLDIVEAAEEDGLHFEIVKSHDGEYTRLTCEDTFE